MWCPYHQREMECVVPCSDCCFGRHNEIYGSNYYYKCPNCHGEFSTPVMDGCAGYICPFCGRKMEGLK